VALLASEIVLAEARASALRGVRLPLVIAAIPLAAWIADWVVGLVLRRRGLRVGLELTAAVVALVVLARPLSVTPVSERVVTAVPPPAGTPDVIVVSLDTTRADHLATYGYERETSPNLSRFAEDAVLFTQARSTAGWTLPGHASMLTGLYPSRHGARLAGSWLEGESIDGRRNVAYPLKPEVVTLAESLRDHGYSTGAFVANFSYLYRDFGLSQGFQHYDDAPGLLLRVEPPVVNLARWLDPAFAVKPFRTARDINAHALAWLDAAPKGRPAFLFLNYMEPHQPWVAEPPHDEWVRDLPQQDRLSHQNLYTHEAKDFSADELEFIIGNYDGQVAAMDAALAELLGELQKRGRYENALVIVTADHGELLGDHGEVGHMGRMLYEGLIKVPLVVKYPGADRQRGRVDAPVQVVDVTPTALEEAGAPKPAGLQGEHLSAVTHPSIAEEEVNPFLVKDYGAVYDRAMRVVFDGRYKLITTSRGENMLFDLTVDPREQRDIASSQPERVEAMAKQVNAVTESRVAAAEHSKQVN
jgi:arylsulfatase A-like enzyme